MKKIKILLAVITVLTILSTAVFAADSALSFGADTVEYTEGESLTISVYSTVDASIYKNGHFVMTFDMDVWEFDMDASSVAVGGEKLIADYSVDADPYNEIEVVLSRADYVDVTAGGKVADLVFNKKDGKNAIGTTFDFADNKKWKTGSASSTKLAYSGSIEVVAAAAPEPETPVSVSTTMTVNEKEYTDVPNAVVSGTIENGAFNGSIVVDYWKDGVKALAPKVFSSFANMPTFSGSGSATFSVAIMGVPSNVTITSITVQ